MRRPQPLDPSSFCCRVWSPWEGSVWLLGLLGPSRFGFPPSGAGPGSTLCPGCGRDAQGPTPSILARCTSGPRHGAPRLIAYSALRARVGPGALHCPWTAGLGSWPDQVSPASGQLLKTPAGHVHAGGLAREWPSLVRGTALCRELTQGFPRSHTHVVRTELAKLEEQGTEGVLAGGEGSGRVCDPRLFGAARSRAPSPWGSRGLSLAAPDNYFSSGNQ